MTARAGRGSEPRDLLTPILGRFGDPFISARLYLVSHFMVPQQPAANCIIYEEPPYTEEEEMDFYRRVGGGPVSILHAPKQPKPKDDEKDKRR